MAIERVADGEAEFYELRCQKCGRTKRSGRGEAVSIGSHDIEMGRRPRLPRR